MVISRQLDEFELKWYFSAFIDILGVSSKLLRLDEALGHVEPESGGFELAAAALNPIELFRAYFRSYFEQSGLWKEGLGIDKLSSSEQEKANEVFGQDPIIQHMGDCILISVPFDLNRPVRTLRGVSQIMTAVAGAQLMSTLRGNLCRGGVEIGSGCEAYPGEILGGCVAKAVMLEKEARSPFVAVGANLKGFLKDSDKFLANVEGIDRQMSDKLVGRLLGMLAGPPAGKYVDYACKHVLDTFMAKLSQNVIEGVLADGLKRIVFEAECPDSPEGVRGKYEWTFQYLVERLRDDS